MKFSDQTNKMKGAAWPREWVQRNGKPQGVALIATLIMLSLVTFMTIVFLGVARRERRAVLAYQDLGNADLAKETAEAQAQKKLIGGLLFPEGRMDRPDPWAYWLFVSTNYANSGGFSNVGGITDVNDYDAMNQSFINSDETRYLSHLKNLKVLPRVPVFKVRYTNGYNDVATGLSGTGTNNSEGRYGRFFLDFNRNQQFEPTFTKFQTPVNDGMGNPVFAPTGIGHANWLSNVPAFLNNYVAGNYVGDPQWIGILNDSTQPHSRSNQFGGRYAYLVMPAGKSLDINNIHNQNKLGYSGRRNFAPPPDGEEKDGYTRNHGVGSWEINLASFISALTINTNTLTDGSLFSWNYRAYDPVNFEPTDAIDPDDNVHQDAVDLLRYRFNINLGELDSMEEGGLSPSALTNLIASGADMAGEFRPYNNYGRIGYYSNDVTLPWIGGINSFKPSDPTNRVDRRFKTIEELFDEDTTYDDFRLHMQGHSKSRSDFNSMSDAEAANAINDRYTFYRLLSSMGTESVAPSGRFNVNYDTTTSSGSYAYPGEPDLIASGKAYAPWSPLKYFTTLAQLLIDSSITTNVTYDDSRSSLVGEGAYITNYFLGSSESGIGSNYVSGLDTNRYTLVGRVTRVIDATSKKWSSVPLGWEYHPTVGTNVSLYASAFVTNASHTLPLTNITVFPFNQYTPVLHRLLQVAANIHETAGNSREWVYSGIYPVGQQVRRRGLYYRCVAAGSTGNDPSSSGDWVYDGPGLPHVFQPIFRYNLTNDSIYISEWQEVVGTTFTNITYLDLGVLADRNTLRDATDGSHPFLSVHDIMAKGFPLVIGAKGPTRNPNTTYQEVIGSGIPNFNEISIKSLFSATRKLQVTKTNVTDRDPSYINAMFIVSLRTVIGAEAWNPYPIAYPRELELRTTNVMTVLVENETGPILTNIFTNSNVEIIPGNKWLGSVGAVEYSGRPSSSHPSFRPLFPNDDWVITLPPSVYFPPAYAGAPGIGPSGALLPLVDANGNVQPFIETNLFPAMNLTLTVSNWFTYMAIDTRFNRIVDYVNLTNLTARFDLTNIVNALIPDNSDSAVENRLARFFSQVMLTNNPLFPTTITNSMPVGIYNQLRVAMDTNGVQRPVDWLLFNPSPAGNPTRLQANVASFAGFVGRPASGDHRLKVQAPYTPSLMAMQDLRFEVNDPIVHYLVRDMLHLRGRTNDAGFEVFDISNGGGDIEIVAGLALTNINNTAELRLRFGLPGSIGRLNISYRPWGGNPAKDPSGPKGVSEHYNMGLKDPSVYFAGNWDFPERKFGSIGWLGRVHRGTPWQTIYMKARVASAQEWRDWGQDPDTHPTNDWNLFDNITAHPNKKAATGLLGVNQTNFAAWAAVLGGLSYLENSAINANQIPPSVTAGLIVPWSNHMHQIVGGIVRSRLENYSFTRKGQILAVPELSTGSPFARRHRTVYFPGILIGQGSEVIHRGVRWLSLTPIGALDPPPPSVREHQIAEFRTPQLMAEFITTNYGVKAGTYLWYVDPYVGRQLYHADIPITDPAELPVRLNLLNGNGGWTYTQWRESLNASTGAEMFGLEENMIERIPQKIMGLLKRAPQPRVVIYSFGQALAPAHLSEYAGTDTRFTGLITNYSVISASASRTILRVEGIPPPGLIPFHTNAAPVVFPRVVVEDYKQIGN